MFEQTPEFSRRTLLLSALAATAVNGLPGLAMAAAAPSVSSVETDFTRMLDQFADEVLRLLPSIATSLGLDHGARAGLKSRLEDLSDDGAAAWAAQVRSMQQRLTTVDRAALSGTAQIQYDTVRYAAGAGIDGLRFRFGGAASGFTSGTAPFPVTQQDGSIYSVPEFIDTQHQIADAADADAYLDRVAALARLMDQETARIAEQFGQGIMPPDFICRPALAQLRAIRATPLAKQTLVTSVTSRTQKLGIAGDWNARARKLVERAVYPALDRQIAACARMAAKAGPVAGVHRLPDGAAYYEWALRVCTSTTYSPSELHALGMQQNLELQSRIETLLKKQGLTRGTVGARLQALSKDKNSFYPDNERGRAELIAYCNQRIDTVRQLMPRLSHLDLKVPLRIKRVPAEIEAGAPLGYMQPGSLDGSRPSTYYINLKSTTLWPKSELATLTAHEGIPGHAWQNAYLAERHDQLPLLSSILGFNAFAEGWALYAEQLVDELGVYADDPLSQIGYLQAQQFRACRLVVDTGIHAMKWTREQAIRFLVGNSGRGLGAMTSEVDRYTVWPGQACGYKTGHNEILRQRERARAALGGRFDLAAFNDAVVRSCGVPLTVLPAVIDQYIGAGVA